MIDITNDAAVDLPCVAPRCERDRRALFRFHFRRHPAAADRFPLAALNGDSVAESWYAEGEIVAAEADGVSVWRATDELMAHVRADPGDSLQIATDRCYERLLRLIDSCPGFRPARFWNLIPSINGTENDLERYRRFSIARHRAFGRGLRRDCAYPSASAIGSLQGELEVIGLATRRPLTHLENPRQVSAFRYPRHYGPRSPSFARATFLGTPGSGLLLISGTASIVGHESRHRDNPAAQVTETLRNLHSLLVTAEERLGCRLTLEPATTTLRVYVRQRADYAIVRETLQRSLPDDLPTVFVEADICRPELLVEIEATVRSRESSATSVN